MLEKTERAIKNEQYRDTSNIGYTRHMKKKKTKTPEKSKEMGNKDLTKNPG